MRTKSRTLAALVIVGLAALVLTVFPALAAVPVLCVLCESIG